MTVTHSGYRRGMQTLEGTIGIRELSERTALSMDTLRWYEREGLLPLVDRTATGQRRYGRAAVRFVLLVQALRRTGMPVAEVPSLSSPARSASTGT